MSAMIGGPVSFIDTYTRSARSEVLNCRPGLMYVLRVCCRLPNVNFRGGQQYARLSTARTLHESSRRLEVW